jgi:tRNA 2-thiocytidine biosynthesis protein TtcA
VIPCGCSQRTGTVRRSLRDMLGDLEKDHPFLKETMLSAMGNIQTGRLLDPKYLDMDGTSETAETETSSPFAILGQP